MAADRIQPSLPYTPGLPDEPFEAPVRDEVLPRLTSFAPSDEPIEAELASLVGHPSISEQLATALRPQISNREILAPHRYHALLESAAHAFRSLSEAPTGHAAVFTTASGVLDEERALQDLLSVYRHALHQA